jgi:predicted phosphoribosyltransferase
MIDPGTGRIIGGAAWGGPAVMDRRVAGALGGRQVRHLRRETLSELRSTARRYGARTLPVEGRKVVLAVDWLDCPWPLIAAVKGLRRKGAAELTAAVGIASRSAVMNLLPEVDLLCCLDLRTDDNYFINEAYREEGRMTHEKAMALWSGASDSV